MAALTPISLAIFEERVQPEKPLVKAQTNNQVERPKEDFSPSQCLFCSFSTQDDAEGLDAIAEHMFAIHGLFVPDQAMLSDLRSFLGYLAMQVRVWHECLYCGVSRASTQAAQDHMRDTGHCMLNFEREPELADFWELGSGMEGRVRRPVFQTDPKGIERTRLLHEKTVTSNRIGRPMLLGKRTRETQMVSQSTPERLQTQHSPEPRKCRHLARRDELGVQNISSQQRHALVAAIQRSQKDEATAMRRKEWTYARKANDQKHDQAYGALSWAKGGMHNLLPR